MAQTPPRIQDDVLAYQQDGKSVQVTVGSAGWYSWLETASTLPFAVTMAPSLLAKNEQATGAVGRIGEPIADAKGSSIVPI
jgi:hypothetical protein